MSKRQFKFMNAGDAQDLVFTEVCKVLEMTTAPARYQFDGAIFLVDLEYAQRGVVPVVL